MINFFLRYLAFTSLQVGKNWKTKVSQATLITLVVLLVYLCKARLAPHFKLHSEEIALKRPFNLDWQRQHSSTLKNKTSLTYPTAKPLKL